MKYSKVYAFILLLIIASCGDDGNGDRTFYVYVQDGENGFANVPNATVKIYSSADAWLTNQSPIKTFTTDAKGAIATNDKFSKDNILYAENGTYDNWPAVLQNTMQQDPNLPNALSGNAQLFKSFQADFKGVEGKQFLLTDVLVNGVSIFSNVDVCSKDNFLKLQMNAKLFYSEGTTVCAGKPASQEYDIVIPRSKNETKLDGSMNAYEMLVSWPDVNNYMYISTDFTKIYFKANDTNGLIVTQYTRQ